MSLGGTITNRIIIIIIIPKYSYIMHAEMRGYIYITHIYMYISARFESTHVCIIGVRLDVSMCGII